MGSEGSPDLAKCLPLAQTSLSHLEGGSPLQGPAEAGLGRGPGRAEHLTRAWGFAKVSGQSGDCTGLDEARTEVFLE